MSSVWGSRRSRTLNSESSRIEISFSKSVLDIAEIVD
jgi:hypothetical protein